MIQEAVEYAETNNNVIAAVKFNVSEATIRNWRDKYPSPEKLREVEKLKVVEKLKR